MSTSEICMEIKVLHKRGMSIRAIAKELLCKQGGSILNRWW